MDEADFGVVNEILKVLNEKIIDQQKEIDILTSLVKSSEVVPSSETSTNFES